MKLRQQQPFKGMSIFEKIEQMHEEKRRSNFLNYIRFSDDLFTREGMPARFVAVLSDLRITAPLVMEVPTNRTGTEWEGWRMVNYYLDGRFFQSCESAMDLMIFDLLHHDAQYLPVWHEDDEVDTETRSVWLLGDHKDYVAIAKRMAPQYKEMIAALGLSGTLEEQLREIDEKKLPVIQNERFRN